MSYLFPLAVATIAAVGVSQYFDRSVRSNGAIGNAANRHSTFSSVLAASSSTTHLFNKPPGSTINELPDDVLREVLLFLDMDTLRVVPFVRRSWYHVLGEPLRFPSRVGDEPRSTDDGVDESSLSSALLLWKRQLAQVMGMNMGDSRDEPRSMDDGVDESSLSSALMLWKRQLTQVMGSKAVAATVSSLDPNQSLALLQRLLSLHWRTKRRLAVAERGWVRSPRTAILWTLQVSVNVHACIRVCIVNHCKAVDVCGLAAFVCINRGYMFTQFVQLWIAWKLWRCEINYRDAKPCVGIVREAFLMRRISSNGLISYSPRIEVEYPTPTSSTTASTYRTSSLTAFSRLLTPYQTYFESTARQMLSRFRVNSACQLFVAPDNIQHAFLTRERHLNDLHLGSLFVIGLKMICYGNVVRALFPFATQNFLNSPWWSSLLSSLDFSSSPSAPITVAPTSSITLVPASVPPVINSALTAPLQPAALYLRAGFDRWSLPLLPSSLSHRGVAIVAGFCLWDWMVLAPAPVWMFVFQTARVALTQKYGHQWSPDNTGQFMASKWKELARLNYSVMEHFALPVFLVVAHMLTVILRNGTDWISLFINTASHSESMSTYRPSVLLPASVHPRVLLSHSALQTLSRPRPAQVFELAVRFDIYDSRVSNDLLQDTLDTRNRETLDLNGSVNDDVLLRGLAFELELSATLEAYDPQTDQPQWTQRIVVPLTLEYCADGSVVEAFGIAQFVPPVHFGPGFRFTAEFELTVAPQAQVTPLLSDLAQTLDVNGPFVETYDLM